MKNNYDLILNFETNDAEPLTVEMIKHILSHANYMALTIEHFNNVTIHKAVISQAVDSRKITNGSKFS